MAKNNVVVLEKGVVLPGEQYGDKKITDHLKELLISANKNTFELGIVEEAEDFFILFKEEKNKEFGTPFSFQYKLIFGNNEWIKVRDFRKSVVNSAFAAFLKAREENKLYPHYQKTLESSLSMPAVYNKNRRTLHDTGEEMEFYEFYNFSEMDEKELKKLVSEIKRRKEKEEAKPKFRHAPPVETVSEADDDRISIQEMINGKTKAPIVMSIMAPADVEAETQRQENEVIVDESPKETSFFAETAEPAAETEPVVAAEPAAAKTSARKKTAAKADSQPTAASA